MRSPRPNVAPYRGRYSHQGHRQSPHPLLRLVLLDHRRRLPRQSNAHGLLAPSANPHIEDVFPLGENAPPLARSPASIMRVTAVTTTYAAGRLELTSCFGPLSSTIEFAKSLIRPNESEEHQERDSDADEQRPDAE